MILTVKHESCGGFWRGSADEHDVGDQRRRRWPDRRV